jgi:hypothetical protein
MGVEFMGFFFITVKFPMQSVIMPYIEKLGLWSDWRVDHRQKWPYRFKTQTFSVLRPFE